MRKILIIVFVIAVGASKAQTSFEPSSEFAIGASILKKEGPLWNNRARFYAGTVYLSYSKYFKPKTFWKASVFGRFENAPGKYSKFNGYYDISPAFGLYRYCHLFKLKWLQFNYGIDAVPMFAQKKYVTPYEYFRRDIYGFAIAANFGLDFKIKSNFAIGLHFAGGPLVEAVNEVHKVHDPITNSESRSLRWYFGGRFTNPPIVTLKFKIR